MLEKTKLYLGSYHPGIYDHTGYKEMLIELNEAISASSVSAVTKHIREEGFICPAIIKQVDTEQYTFHKCAKKVFLDFEEAYISQEGARYGFGEYTQAPVYIDARRLLVSNSHPIYDGYYLAQWIHYGNLCEDCGIAFIDYDADGLCESCNQAYTLLEYSAKAEDILETETTSETLFGVELEYENITAKQVASCLKGHAISKRDGTIRNGAEVVTRPASVSTHKKSLQAFYDQVKVKAKSNTGMHVHVDKSKLSNYEIGFMLEFLNKPSLVPDIEKIAGRSYSTNPYCKTSSNMKMSWGNSFDEDGYKLIKKTTDKYSPLNTRKDKTIEIRIFSSPESHEEVCAKLDFVAALVKYSSPYSVSVKRLQDKFTWEVFTEFVKANRKTYPHFVSYFLKG